MKCFNYLKTFEFYVFDIKSKGILFLEACDKFNFKLNGSIYSTLLLNDEAQFDDGLNENMYIDEPDETNTEYKYADSTDKKINQTYILVDKQNQKIIQQANQITEHEEKLTKVEQDVDSIKQKVKDVIDYKRTVENVSELHLTDAGNCEILKLEIKGNKEFVSELYPRTNLFPRAGLKPNQMGG